MVMHNTKHANLLILTCVHYLHFMLPRTWSWTWTCALWTWTWILRTWTRARTWNLRIGLGLELGLWVLELELWGLDYKSVTKSWTIVMHLLILTCGHCLHFTLPRTSTCTWIWTWTMRIWTWTLILRTLTLTWILMMMTWLQVWDGNRRLEDRSPAAGSRGRAPAGIWSQIPHEPDCTYTVCSWRTHFPSNMEHWLNSILDNLTVNFIDWFMSLSPFHLHKTFWLSVNPKTQCRRCRVGPWLRPVLSASVANDRRTAECTEHNDWAATIESYHRLLPVYQDGPRHRAIYALSAAPASTRPSTVNALSLMERAVRGSAMPSIPS